MEESGLASGPVYTVSKYGRPVILLGAGRYNHHSTTGPKTVWRCVKWSDGCRACLTTVDSVLVKVADTHTHYREGGAAGVSVARVLSDRAGRRRVLPEQDVELRPHGAVELRQEEPRLQGLRAHHRPQARQGQRSTHAPLGAETEEYLRSLLKARFTESSSMFVGAHKYFRHSRSLLGNRVRWTCSQKHKHKCRASAVTVDGVLVATKGLHSHP
ncbi:FLYWCH zinc finger domain-containing protein [Phthorimaea operculella]|nr:FLYWCH zinc finger domain-containing protein [Phthorimaea operculella]